MEMEAQEEFMGSNDLTQIIKGKRTKRQRSSSPYKAVNSSSSSGYVGGEGETGIVVEEYGSSSPTTSSTRVYERTEEEEDMANCLILLAQGDGPRQSFENNGIKVEKFSARKYSDMTSSATTNRSGFYIYECKTCNRSFPSFQALGGHRASHKKPKPAIEEKKSTSLLGASMDDLEDCQLNKSSPDDSLSLQIANTNSMNNKGFHGNKPKIHECSICGSEFTSGQALGGHMRRHRTNTGNQVGMSTVDSSATTDHQSNINGNDEIKPRNILGLDLNLPAPEEDHHHREPKFQFTSTQQALVFSAPALVDCHY